MALPSRNRSRAQVETSADPTDRVDGDALQVPTFEVLAHVEHEATGSDSPGIGSREKTEKSNPKADHGLPKALLDHRIYLRTLVELVEKYRFSEAPA